MFHTTTCEFLHMCHALGAMFCHVNRQALGGEPKGKAHLNLAMLQHAIQLAHLCLYAEYIYKHSCAI